MREHVLALLQRHLPNATRPGAGGNVLTKCPFHKEGQEHRPSFSINIDLGVFHCFTCHVAGDVRYLLKLLGLSRDQIDVELKVIQPMLDTNRARVDFEREHFFATADPFQASQILPESLLGVYDWCPNKLLEAGFQMEVLRDFEIGFDKRLERITYPLRDMYGNLAGIAGGMTLPHQQPKYLVYQGGRRDTSGRWIPGDFGPWFDDQFPGFTCENHDYIWNFHRVYPRISQLPFVSDTPASVILVEGYKACMWMVQNGFPNTVALMGSYISEKQQRMLHRLGGDVVLFFDNDNAGREATKRIGKLLWKPLHGHLKVMRYPAEDADASFAGESDSQPDDYEAEGLAYMWHGRLDFHVYMSQEKESLTWR